MSIKLNILLLFIICRACNGQRRIDGDTKVTSPKPYVVYLVKATLSHRTYDYWLCGGALVTSDFIITSAACVEDVQYLFAIAGYDKYVTDDKINEDRCTKEMKKKVVFTCVPVSYDFDFDRIEKWAQIDIALAKVESPYDFEDSSFLKYCSYIPKKIPINFDPKYQKPDTDCMVMGWGHARKWRKQKDKQNYNSEDLKYASTMVIKKSDCVKEFEYYPKMVPIIQQYMICTLGDGVIDDQGEPKEEVLDPSKYDLLDGCPPVRRMDNTNPSCKQQYDTNNSPIDFLINARREIPKTNKTYHHNYTTYDYIRDARKKMMNRTRRHGICQVVFDPFYNLLRDGVYRGGSGQNDHGGPLVTWVGTTEVLIGVASVFKIDKEYNCVGPYLHTSTQSNAAFIDCVLNESAKKNEKKRSSRRSALCDSPPNIRGFDMIENHISWKDHPAGPAENELREPKFGP